MKKLKLYFIEFDKNVFMNFKINIIITFYINNIFIINFNKIDIKHIKNDFNIKFYISNLKSYIYYLNIIVKKNRQIEII